MLCAEILAEPPLSTAMAPNHTKADQPVYLRIFGYDLHCDAVTSNNPKTSQVGHVATYDPYRTQYAIKPYHSGPAVELYRDQRNTGLLYILMAAGAAAALVIGIAMLLFGFMLFMFAVCWIVVFVVVVGLMCSVM